MVGQTYLEKGSPVVVLRQWRQEGRKSGPRNVAIKRADGSIVVRPFRGLRKRPQYRVWYCTECGWQTLSLPSGEVRCGRCGHLGLSGSEAKPIRVACPLGCDWSGWDDGGINDHVGRHLRIDHGSDDRMKASADDGSDQGGTDG